MPSRLLARVPAAFLFAVLALAVTQSVGASAQSLELLEEIPPPPTSETAPQPETQTPPQVRRTTHVPMEWNPSAPSGGSQFGNPEVTRMTRFIGRRGDSLEDRAQSGEIIDLMITSGAYGMLLANGIVNWSGADSGRDLVTIRFGATFVGATLSLTGLLAVDAPRGTPTVMTIGLRYGAIAGGLMAGALRMGEDTTLGALTLGGLLGFGLGAGLGYGLRPHISRARFVEAGAFWGASLGFLMSGAVRGDSSTTFALGLGGMSFGVLTNALVASLTNVAAGRGWLLNAGFAAPAALAAFVAAVAADTSAEVVFGVSAAVGLLGLGIVFAVTDGIQDPGWVEDEVISSLQLGVSPSADGQGGTVSLSGQF